jgi:hypothetical protein
MFRSSSSPVALTAEAVEAVVEAVVVRAVIARHGMAKRLAVVVPPNHQSKLLLASRTR